MAKDKIRSILPSGTQAIEPLYDLDPQSVNSHSESAERVVGASPCSKCKSGRVSYDQPT